MDPSHRISASAEVEAEDATWLRERIGKQVGSLHRVVRHLGSGGMGHVFLVEHMQLGAYAAAKLPQPGNSCARKVLAHEAKLLAQLQHPNILGVHDFGQTADGLDYLLMEYVGGIELDAWLDSCGSMAPERALHILKQVASAVDYLHAHNIVHCDIKPANVMFDPRAHDFVKLIDFGVACEGSRKERRGLVGTPAYMAPEQARGEPSGPAVDIYGVAALALELLTGRPPYDYDDPQDALTAILSTPPALPSSRGMRRAGLDAVFAKGLHSDPAQRYASASEFVEALDTVWGPAGQSLLDPRQTRFYAGAPLTAAAGRAATIKSRSHVQPRRTADRSTARGLLACARAALAALVPHP